MDVIALGIQAGIALFSAGATWASLRGDVKAAKDAAEDICARLKPFEDAAVIQMADRAERGAQSLHRRVDEHERQIAVLENNNEHLEELIKTGIADLKASVNALHGLLGEIFRGERERRP